MGPGQATVERPLEFVLKTDKRGVIRASYFSRRAFRSFPIALAKVRQMEAEGRAVEVPAHLGGLA